jgi:AcrR family transcriptional regulator
VPVGTRTTRRSPYDLERLLAVAVGVFIERGYDGTSMEDLARAAGITKSSIYHHIDSKEQLLRMAVDRALDSLFELLEEEAPTHLDAAGNLEVLLGRMVDVLIDKLPYVTLLLRVRGNTEAERLALERRRIFDQILTRAIIAGVVDGSIRDDLDPGVLEKLVTGMINSVTEWYRPGRMEVHELRRSVVAMAMSGLRAGR